MSRPPLSATSPTRRIHMMITEADHALIENWRWENRVPSWGEAARLLMMKAIKSEGDSQ